MQGPTFLGPKFLKAQISWGPISLGTKKLRGPNEIGDHFSDSHFGYIPELKFKSRTDYSTNYILAVVKHNFDLIIFYFVGK